MILTVTLNPAVDETLSVHRLQLGETNRIEETSIDPGGKGLNVARVIRRLGRPTVAIALVGGETGEFIKNRLEREDIEKELVEIEGTTRVNISVIDESTGVQTNLNHDGPIVDPAELHALELRVEEWLPEVVLTVLGGSLPPGVPPDSYARMIRWMRENDVRTVLDTSGDALVRGVEARPYMIKPNVREAQELLGRELKTEGDIVEGARELTEREIKAVVVSMGARGAIAVSRDGAWKAVPPEVSKESTLGAGDSMVAGLAIGVSEHSSLPESLALGTAAATATVMTPGTELCRVEDVQALLPKVKIEQLQ